MCDAGHAEAGRDRGDGPASLLVVGAERAPDCVCDAGHAEADRDRGVGPVLL